MSLRSACNVLVLIVLAAQQGFAVETPSSSSSVSASAGKTLVYVGTYTKRKSKGIYLFSFDAASGALTPVGEPAESDSPSFLATHPSKPLMYAVNEAKGEVSSFRIDPASGKLTMINKQSSQGGAPCHLALDPTGKYLVSANYTGGNLAVLPVADDGSLQPAAQVVQHSGEVADKKRQGGPHAHSIYFDAAGKLAFACDLGLDKVLVYDFAGGKLAPHDPPALTVAPRSGPRHLAFHPSGKLAYVINEISSTITAATYDAAKGSFSELQTISTLPQETPRNSTAEIVVHPSGKWLYGSNRGHDSLAIFSIDAATGKLTAQGHQSTLGKAPRNFAIDPSGGWLLAANMDSDSIHVFSIDPASGALKPANVAVEVSMPVCILFHRLY